MFRTARHTVRTQHGVTASAGQRRGDVEIRSYLQDAAGRRSLVFDLSMTHDRFGSSRTEGEEKTKITSYFIIIQVYISSRRFTRMGGVCQDSYSPDSYAPHI